MNGTVESYEIYYFDFKGKAELARILLEYGGLPWTHRKVVDWPREKPHTPFEQVPVLVIKDSHGKEIHLAQSAVMSRYLADRVGLLPADPHARAVTDMLCESTMEVLEHAAQWRWNMADAPAEWREWAQRRLATEVLPRYVRSMSRVLAANGDAGKAGYLTTAVGVLTLAEFVVYYAVSAINRWIPDYFNAESAPALLKVVHNVAQHPRIRAYLASDRCPTQ